MPDVEDHRQFTLYVDESGQFNAGAGQVLGIRIVAGLLLPGQPEEHRAPANRHLEEALEWWPGPRHACQIKPITVARSICSTSMSVLPLSMAKARDELRSVSLATLGGLRARKPHLHKLVGKESARLLSRFRGCAETLIRELGGGELVLCYEHNLTARSSRYRTMLDALVEQVMWRLACSKTAPGEAVTLQVWAEERTDSGVGADPESMVARVTGATRRGALCQVRLQGPTFKQSGAHPCLDVADATAHALGPGAAVHVPVKDGYAKSLGLKAIRARVRDLLGARTPMTTVGTGDCHEVLQQVLDGALTASKALDRIRKLHTALPPGGLRCVVDEAERLLRRFRDLGL